MPRTSDHAARRRQVAEALMAITSEKGLDAASLPQIAKKAGVSVGLIQRYFRTKDELLIFAFEHLYERTLERLSDLAPAATFEEGLFNGLKVLLPLDEERVAEGRVLLAYMARAAVIPELTLRHTDGLKQIRESCARAIVLAQQAGEAPKSLDSTREAAMLATFVDGLNVQMLSAPESYTITEAEEALSAYLKRIFGDQR